MDRRTQKTRKAIFNAFDTLIAKMNYSKISVQNIIDEANIGRSTFYEHFETKDYLLRSKCTDLFEHIFIPDKTEKTHAFPSDSSFKEKITHILYHLLDDKKVIKGILSSESKQIFLQYFRTYLSDVIKKEDIHLQGVSDEFIINHISGTFIVMVTWWVNRNFKENPTELTYYFFNVLQFIK